MKIKLDCGKTVRVDALHFAKTYASVLMGKPSDELNKKIIERSKKAMSPVWGERKTHVLQPRVNKDDPAHPKLPEDQLTAWLSCAQPTKPEFMGSHLVVVLYVDKCWERPMVEVIQEAIRHLPWGDLAEDFDY